MMPGAISSPPPARWQAPLVPITPSATVAMSTTGGQDFTIYPAVIMLLISVGGFTGNAYANGRGYTGWDKTKCIFCIGGLAGGAAGYFAAHLVVSATGVAGISVTSAGISTVATVGTSFRRLGTLIVNNGQQIIDWEKPHGMVYKG